MKNFKEIRYNIKYINKIFLYSIYGISYGIKKYCQKKSIKKHI